MASVRDEISKNFLYYRKRSGLTQKQIGELLGVKNTAISNWEKGANSIDIDTLVNICRIFNISINEMFGSYANSYNENACNKCDDVIQLYRQLDELDKAEIRGEIKQMLKSNKYLELKEQKHA